MLLHFSSSGYGHPSPSLRRFALTPLPRSRHAPLALAGYPVARRAPDIPGSAWSRGLRRA